jgi:hypothetical protein
LATATWYWQHSAIYCSLDKRTTSTSAQTRPRGFFHGSMAATVDVDYLSSRRGWQKIGPLWQTHGQGARSLLGAFCGKVCHAIAADPGLGSGRLLREYLGILWEGCGRARISEKRHRRAEIFTKISENFGFFKGRHRVALWPRRRAGRANGLLDHVEEVPEIMGKSFLFKIRTSPLRATARGRSGVFEEKIWSYR